MLIAKWVRQMWTQEPMKALAWVEQRLQAGSLSDNDYQTVVELCPSALAEETLRTKKPGTSRLSSPVLYTVVLNRSIRGRTDRRTSEILARMKKEDGIQPDAAMYRVMTMAYLSVRGILGEMERQQMRPSQAIHERLLVYFATRKMVAQARALETDMIAKGLVSSKTAQTTLLTCYGAEGGLSEAIHVFNRICDSRAHRERNVMSLASAFCRHGKPEKAEAFLHQLEKQGQSTRIAPYNLVLTHLMRQRLAKQANSFFEEMKDRPGAPKPDHITYGTIMRVHALANQMYRVDDLFSEMRGAGLVPTVATYNAVVENWGRNGRVDRAEEIVEDMEVEKVSPDVHTYNHLIYAYAMKNQLGKAEKVLRRLKDKGITANATSYCNFLDGCVTNNSLTKAKQVWKELRESVQMRPSELGYSAAVTLFVKTGSMDKALEIFTEMRKTVGAKKHVYYTLIGAYGEQAGYGNIQAMQLFKTAKEVDKVLPFSSFLEETIVDHYVATVHEMPSPVACVAIRWALFNLKPTRDLRIVTSRRHRPAQEAPSGGNTVRHDVKQMVEGLGLVISFERAADARLHVSRRVWSNWKKAFD